MYRLRDLRYRDAADCARRLAHMAGLVDVLIVGVTLGVLRTATTQRTNPAGPCYGGSMTCPNEPTTWALISVGAQLIHVAVTLHYHRRATRAEQYARDIAKRLRAASVWSRATVVAPEWHAPRRPDVRSLHEADTISFQVPDAETFTRT